jgi:hypothetical protein
MSDDVFHPEYDLGTFRYAVARYVKLLIRARWKVEPGFLSEEELRKWNLAAIQSDRYPSWHLLADAAMALAHLNTEFLPRCGSGGVRPTDSETPAGRLIFDVAILANWVSTGRFRGGGPYHNSALLEASETARAGEKVDWNSLVNWSMLPSIRTDLDKLPHPPLGDDDGTGSNTFRWRAESKRWDILFEGKAILVHNLVGMFYLSELVNRPGKIITASKLKSAHVSWLADPASHLRRQAESAALVRLAGEHDDGNSCDVLDSPGQDLGDVLDKEARANYRSRIAAIPAEIESLRTQGKTAQAVEMERELEELKRAVRSSLDLGGRPKKVSAVHKRDQNTVGQAIRRALEKLKLAEPQFYRYLRPSLKIGWNCCYLPGPATVRNKPP